MQNRQNDLEIRRENCRNQALSTYKKLELSFNEMYDVIESIKTHQLKIYENLTESQMKKLITNDNEVEQQLKYYQSLTEDFKKIQEMEEGQEEFIFNYFFKKQEEINQKIEQDQQYLQSNDDSYYKGFWNQLKANQGEVYNEGVNRIMNKLNELLVQNKG